MKKVKFSTGGDPNIESMKVGDELPVTFGGKVVGSAVRNDDGSLLVSLPDGIESNFIAHRDPQFFSVALPEDEVPTITRGELREVIFSAHGMGTVSDDPPLNPDCRDGKHQACAGDGWDLEKDEPTTCHCTCHN